jgi:hypothetical protein
MRWRSCFPGPVPPYPRLASDCQSTAPPSCRALPRPGVALEKDDLLPGAQDQRALAEHGRQPNPHSRRGRRTPNQSR